jgi:hypothetical protein
VRIEQLTPPFNKCFDFFLRGRTVGGRVRDLNDSDGLGAVKYKVVVAPPSRGLLGREEGKGGVADPPS